MTGARDFPTETVSCSACGAPVTRTAGSGLRAARVAAGLSLRDVGAVVPCSASHLHDVEVGNRRATERVLDGYSRAIRTAAASSGSDPGRGGMGEKAPSGWGDGPLLPH